MSNAETQAEKNINDEDLKKTVPNTERKVYMLHAYVHV